MFKIKPLLTPIVAAVFLLSSHIVGAQTSNAYSTGIGLRGGVSSGLSIKHFVSGNAAAEFIIGSRWRGLSITGIYEIHKDNALGISGLVWEYGIGAHVGFYDGYNYGWKYQNDPYYRNRSVTAVGVVGILGLEYRFREIPFTIGADIIPYFDFNNGGNGFVDGSAAIRYVF